MNYAEYIYKDITEDISDVEVINLYNDFAVNDGFEPIYTNNSEFLDTIFSKPSELMTALQDNENYNYTDNYAQFDDGTGELKSGRTFEAFFDYDDLVNILVENEYLINEYEEYKSENGTHF